MDTRRSLIPTLLILATLWALAGCNDDAPEYSAAADEASCLEGCAPCAAPDLCGSDGALHCDACALGCLGLEARGASECAGGEPEPLPEPTPDPAPEPEPEPEGSQGLGRQCSEAQRCARGMECLPVSLSDDGQCVEQGSACTALCDEDADCAALSDNVRCFTDCAGVPHCVQVAVDDLPVGGVCELSAQCAEGLECLPIFAEQGGQCSQIASICSVICGEDADCAALGEGLRCLGQCEGERLCGAVR